MTREEEITTLRKYPHHYLWNKKRAIWTQQDLVNIENITADYKKCRVKSKNSGQAMRQYKDGEIIEYESGIKASKKTGIPVQQIYSAVNGYTKQAGGFKWEKIINQ